MAWTVDNGISMVQPSSQHMKLQAGIKLLREIEGYGDPIIDSDRFDAVLKFYRNKGDPLEFDTVLRDPIPCVVDQNGTLAMAWEAATMHRSNVVFERRRILARQADLLPGIYYTILGMKTMGYRHVAIPPHLFAHSMHQVLGIDRDSIVKLEVFLSRIDRQPDRPGVVPAACPSPTMPLSPEVVLPDSQPGSLSDGPG